MSSPKSKVYGRDLCKSLHDALGPTYQQRIEKGLSGDKDAAYALVMSAGRYAGCLPSIAFCLEIGEPGYSTIIESSWIHCSEAVTHFLGARHRYYLRKFMLAAKFDLTGLPSDDFENFRGVAGMDIRKAACGMSWSTSYEAACWFAFRFNKPNPLVIKAIANRSDVLFQCLKQGEHEVILKRAPRATKVGDIDQWRSKAAIRSAAIAANASSGRA